MNVVAGNFANIEVCAPRHYYNCVVKVNNGVVFLKFQKEIIKTKILYFVNRHGPSYFIPMALLHQLILCS